MKKVYLAIPYTGMRESSYEQANQFTVDAMRMGYNPFSPITHSHPLTDYGVPTSWDFWETIDMDWIDICEEVWVLVPHEGTKKVKESTGVQAEIKYALKNNKQIKWFMYDEGELRQISKTTV